MSPQQAQLIVEQLGSSKPSSFEGAILAEAILLFAETLFQTRKGVSMAGVDGAPDWHGYETALWKISERLRPVIAARKDWRERAPIISAIETLCANQRYGKGRQNLVLMLGDFSGPASVPLLGKLLDDTEVVGHALKALTKLRDTSFAPRVEQLIPSTEGWIRAAAKKYLGQKK